MKSGVFVTGTDTNIGKTTVSALLLAALRAQGSDAGYFKPVQTGPDSDTDEVCRLAGAPKGSMPHPVYAFPEPMAPSRAAALHGKVIELSRIREHWDNLSNRRWIVEGAGGLIVPINEQVSIAELIQELKIPSLVVTSTRLGTINHTLLTLEALAFRKIPVAGLVLVGQPDDGLQETLVQRGGHPILAEIPFLENMTPSSLQRLGPEFFPDSVISAIFCENAHLGGTDG